MRHSIRSFALPLLLATCALGATPHACAQGKDFKVALIAGKTGALETYARETESGFMLGLEYLTRGRMTINGRAIKVIVKDDQSKPDLGLVRLGAGHAAGGEGV
jgi:branched-chain amino acid transport system substrate-binding protein